MFKSPGFLRPKHPWPNHDNVRGTSAYDFECIHDRIMTTSVLRQLMMENSCLCKSPRGALKHIVQRIQGVIRGHYHDNDSRFRSEALSPDRIANKSTCWPTFVAKQLDQAEGTCLALELRQSLSFLLGGGGIYIYILQELCRHYTSLFPTYHL